MIKERRWLKTFGAVLLAVLMVWITVFASISAIQADAATATATDGVNVRSGPGTSYSILTTVLTGTNVT